MITFDDALKQVVGSACELGIETVKLSDSLNRVLAENAFSDFDMPPFNKSAMDGFACRRKDLQNELTVIETIPAGVEPQKYICENECSRIMTGAVVPDGADCVIMFEFTEETDGIVKFTGEKTSDNFCFKAEDIKKGDLLLKKGTIISPQIIAVLAAIGYDTVKVSAKPKVGIIATGSELVEPSGKITGAKIRNSNGHQLFAQVSELGAIPNYYGIAKDTHNAIDAAIKKAMKENDLVILSGGVSMGDFDLVPGILENNNVQFFFDSVAMQPGRPTIFGKHRCEDVFCCGLPGNPVSVFIVFVTLLKPFLYKLMGCSFRSVAIPLPLAKTIRRKKTVRQSARPVKIENGKAVPIEYHGPAHINVMCVADGFIRIPVGVTELTEGSIVDVELI